MTSSGNSSSHKAYGEKGGRTGNKSGFLKRCIKAGAEDTFCDHETTWCIWSIGGSEEMRPREKKKKRCLEIDIGFPVMFTGLDSIL